MSRKWGETLHTTCSHLGTDALDAVMAADNYLLIAVRGINIYIHVGYVRKLCSYLQVPYPLDEIDFFMETIRPMIHIPKEKNLLAAKRLAEIAMSTPWMNPNRKHLVCMWYILNLSL